MKRVALALVLVFSTGCSSDHVTRQSRTTTVAPSTTTSVAVRLGEIVHGVTASFVPRGNDLICVGHLRDDPSLTCGGLAYPGQKPAASSCSSHEVDKKSLLVFSQCTVRSSCGNHSRLMESHRPADPDRQICADHASRNVVAARRHIAVLSTRMKLPTDRCRPRCGCGPC
jgi:hypothetical protein